MCSPLIEPLILIAPQTILDIIFYGNNLVAKCALYIISTLLVWVVESRFCCFPPPLALCFDVIVMSLGYSFKPPIQPKSTNEMSTQQSMVRDTLYLYRDFNFFFIRFNFPIAPFGFAFTSFALIRVAFISFSFISFAWISVAFLCMS